MTERPANLQTRARILREIRAFFVARGYLEVETPVRLPTPLPEAHIDAVPSGPWWLQTSPESSMKRLLARGHERIFQLCRCFREGERGDRHLPEFTMLEWYRCGADYRDLMDECEELLPYLAGAVLGGEVLRRQGREVALVRPWPRLTVTEAFRRYGDSSPNQALAEGRFDEVVAFQIEPALAALPTPAFLVDYPAACAALARRRADQPEAAERFELYAGGLELANGFTELVDPVEQRERFARDAEERARCGKPAYPWPERFLSDLKRVPPCAGIALGVDRLVMLLTGAGRIDDVVAFAPEEL